MTDDEPKKCSKCSSTDIMKKNAKLLGPTLAAVASLIATAYATNNCGYIELYPK